MQNFVVCFREEVHGVRALITPGECVNCKRQCVMPADVEARSRKLKIVIISC
jgi:hypothetical protein